MKTLELPSILLIGALPPPAIGPYIATERLLRSEFLRSRFEIDFLDLSDRRDRSTIGRFDLQNLLLGVKHGSQAAFRLLFHDIDLVYLGLSQGIWGYLRDLSFIIPAILLRKRLVLHLRGSEFHLFYQHLPAPLRAVTRAVLARADRVIVLGETLRKIFSGLVSPERIVVIPNGINLEEFPPSPNRQKARLNRILYLSSIKRRKGILHILRALPLILSKHPNAELTVAGNWDTQLTRDKVQEIIRDYDMGAKVHFVGEVRGKDKARLYQDHDLFVFTPVEPEGLPWVILEAMSASLPVITTAQGAIPEVVDHGSTGLIVDPAPFKIANAVCSLMGSPQEARRMGSSGRNRIRQEFSEQTYVSSIAQVFDSVLGLKRPQPCIPTGGAPAKQPLVVNRSDSLDSLYGL